MGNKKLEKVKPNNKLNLNSFYQQKNTNQKIAMIEHVVKKAGKNHKINGLIWNYGGSTLVGCQLWWKLDFVGTSIAESF